MSSSRPQPEPGVTCRYNGALAVGQNAAVASLSILMPVFDERATVEAAIDDALTAELPVDCRELVIVDDGSTDGTRELLGASDVAGQRRRSSTTSGTSARAPPSARRCSTRRASSPRSSTPTSSTAPPTSPTSSSRSSAGEAHVVFGTRAWTSQSSFSFWYVMGNKARHDGDERPLQLLDLGRHDLPQGDAHGALPLAAAPRARLRDRAGDRRARAPRRRADPRGADLLHGALARGRARSSRRSTGSASCARSSAAASTERPATGALTTRRRTAGTRLDIVNR